MSRAARRSISFFAEPAPTNSRHTGLRAATTVLENKLRDILREELGGTYSVRCRLRRTCRKRVTAPRPCSSAAHPENVQKLTDAVMKEVERLRRDGPSEADVKAVRETEKNDLQESYKTNNFWLGSLQTAAILNRDPKRIALRLERADSLTLENIHAAFKNTSRRTGIRSSA